MRISYRKYRHANTTYYGTQNNRSCLTSEAVLNFDQIFSGFSKMQHFLQIDGKPFCENRFPWGKRKMARKWAERGKGKTKSNAGKRQSSRFELTAQDVEESPGEDPGGTAAGCLGKRFAGSPQMPVGEFAQSGSYKLLKLFKDTCALSISFLRKVVLVISEV